VGAKATAKRAIVRVPGPTRPPGREHPCINSLLQRRLARRTDCEARQHRARYAVENRRRGGRGRTPLPVRTPPYGAAAPVPDARDRRPTPRCRPLTTYLPTEILKLYVAAVAAIVPWSGQRSAGRRWRRFFAFLLATPILVWGGVRHEARAVGQAAAASTAAVAGMGDDRRHLAYGP